MEYTKRLKVACIIGTRPEAVKMVPVILELSTRPEVEVVTISTGQHRDIVKPILDGFSIKADFDLEIMKPGQSLADITSATLSTLSPLFDEIKPDIVLVQGDTTTAFSGALCAFYKRIKVGHVEAGLRSYSKSEPFPEEANRCMISKIADIHFAPTELNRKALLKEGISEDTIIVTGNTVIDALFMQLDRLGDTFSNSELKSFFETDTRKILVTAHRRENFGQGILNICESIKKILIQFGDVEVLIPAHPNPQARGPIMDQLGNNPRVKIIEPLDYFDFIQVMNRSYLILTDSGGVQEEAPSLGKPVLVLRNVTERPEGVDAGVVRLLGVEVDSIVCEASKLLSDKTEYDRMAQKVNPYGDGGARGRIVETILKARFFSKSRN